MTKHQITASLAALLLPGSLILSAEDTSLHGPWSGSVTMEHPVDFMSKQHRDAIKQTLKQNRLQLEKSGVLSAQVLPSPVMLDWPLKAADTLKDPGYYGVSNFVDHDTAYPDQLEDYECGTRTYDLDSGYNHLGTDYFLWPFSWNKMEEGAVQVVAAAPGVIVGKFDGNPDHNCDFTNGDWNAVYVQHADGNTAMYGHLKKDSLTSKSVGASVIAGEYLGTVGSSGASTGPHLHLELFDTQYDTVDPYNGACQSDASLWNDQKSYYDSAINAVMTHDTAPEFRACPQTTVTHERRHFFPGERVYFATYYHDQRSGQTSTYTIYRPDGSTYASWSHASPAVHYAASWWYWYYNFSSDVPQGRWRFEVVFEGKTYTHSFTIGAIPSLIPTTHYLLD